MRRMKTTILVLAAAALLPTAALAQDFEGTIRQITVQIGADAITSLAGTDDPESILELDPDRVLEAVRSGEVDALSIQEGSIEIEGQRARMNTEDESAYTIVDGRENIGYTVDPDEQMIMTMDPAQLARATAALPGNGEPSEASIDRLGERTVRGIETTVYRMENGRNLAHVYLSREYGEPMSFMFDYLMELGVEMQKLGMGQQGFIVPEEMLDEGAAIRTVSVRKPRDPSSGGAGSLQERLRARMSGGGLTYFITEYFGLEPGDVPDGRLALPEGYQHQSFTDMVSGRGR